MGKVLIPFALVNNKVKSLKEITRLDDPICLECGEKLIIRNGEKNVKHLAHIPDSKCTYNDNKNTNYQPESYIHKYCKEYLRDNLKYFREYSNKIVVKDGEFKLGGYDDLKITDIEIEYRGLKNELDLDSNYIPDILIRTPKKLVALEVYKTNKKDLSHLKDILSDKNIVVYEIDVNNMEDLSIEKLFRKMKLIHSDLKTQFEYGMHTIQANIIKAGDVAVSKYKQEYEEYKSEYRSKLWNYESEIELLQEEIDLLKYKLKQNEDNVIKLRHQDIEVRRFVAEKYRAKLEYWIQDWLNGRGSSFEELNECTKLTLNKIRASFNGKVGYYIGGGGDNHLQEISCFVTTFQKNSACLDNYNKQLLEFLEIKITPGVQYDEE